MSAVLLGIAIGIVMGLTGAGGGILAVPALVMVMGMPLAQAGPVALVAVAAAAALGAAEGLRRGLVRYRAAPWMALAGILATPLGVMLAARSSEAALLAAFAATLLVVAWRMARAPATDVASPDGNLPLRLDPATGRLRWTRWSAAALAAIGAGAGLLTGLLGVGGGFLIVPALRRYSDIPMRGVVATSLAMIALVSAGAVVAATLAGNAPPIAIAGPFAAGALAGMVAGRVLANRLPPAHLQKGFAAVAAAVALLMLYRAASA